MDASTPLLKELVPDGFKILTKPCGLSDGGGVALIARESLKVTIFNHGLTLESLEPLGVQCCLPGSNSLP